MPPTTTAPFVPMATTAPFMPTAAPLPGTTPSTPPPPPGSTVPPPGPFEVDDPSKCAGSQHEFTVCPSSPSCEEATGCVPKDCMFGIWSEWISVGPCTGLCGRERTVLTMNNECGHACIGGFKETKPCLQDIDWTSCPGAAEAQNDETCAMSDWGAWSTCSGHIAGQTFRDREVVGGKSCAGPLKQTRMCGNPLSKDCELSEWEDWSKCTAACNGREARLRKVSGQAENGGKPCEDVIWQNRPCLEQSCGADTDCKMSTWSPWSKCDAFRQSVRERVVDTPANGKGMRCKDHLKETKDCGLHLGPISCRLAQWGAWDVCDRSCGGGQQYRLRNILDGSHRCGSCPAQTTKESRPCNTDSCFIPRPELDCRLSIWGEWGDCSAECGSGVRFRSRGVEHEAQVGGVSCKGNLKAVGGCQGPPCKKVDCKWSDWDRWSDCSRTCGGGQKRRNRNIAAAPRFGGTPCVAEDKSEVGACNTVSCEGACTDGKWSEWTTWGICSTSCDAGYQSRSREVALPPSICGQPALGNKMEYTQCPGQKQCIPDRDCQLTEWADWTDCSCSCFGTRQRTRTILQFATHKGKSCHSSALRMVGQCNEKTAEHPQGPVGCGATEAPKDCQLSAWSSWLPCAVTCGGSQSGRSRSMSQPAENGGEPCKGALEETGPCAVASCPETCTDCVWAAWSEWSGCNKCGGQMTRHRSIAMHNNYCGHACDTGSAKEVSNCTREGCDRSWCSWSEWATFSSCEKTCGATQLRQRSLAVVKFTAPVGFLFVGEDPINCMGTQEDVVLCDEAADVCIPGCVAQSCLWGAWSAWFEPTCEGLSERHRVIQRTNNECGPPCEGASVETKFVPTKCTEPRDCVFAIWEMWSACDTQMAQSRRTRRISQYPFNGGRDCDGDTVETKSCKTDTRIQNCELDEWSAWMECSKTCGGGYALRHREVSQHAMGGGMPCTTVVQELQPCNTQCCLKDATVNCVLGAWGKWGTCTPEEQRYRARDVLTPASEGGSGCVGSLQETVSCTKDPVNCVLDEWASWEECSVTCGGGQMQLSRKIVTAPKNGGEQCPLALMKITPCQTQPCEVASNCTVGPWKAWSVCSATCGAGQHSRTRELTKLPSGSGSTCIENLEEVGPCEAIVPCSASAPVNCAWEEWSQWGACTKTCGFGSQTRTREVANPAQNGGAPCSGGGKEEAQSCGDDECTDGGVSGCVDDSWAAWGPWSACSATCGGGVQCQIRAIVYERTALYCKSVKGPSQTCQSCNENVPCEVAQDCTLGDWTPWGVCTQYSTASGSCQGYEERSRPYNNATGGGQGCSGDVIQRTGCTVKPNAALGIDCTLSAEKTDCQLSDWGAWGACSDKCFPGQHSRTRTVMVPAVAGGTPCDAGLAETQPCKPDGLDASCKGPPDSDCTWGEWQDWTPCSGCGASQSRHRDIATYKSGKGKACVQTDTDELGGDCYALCQNTSAGEEKLWCSWQEWSMWSSCSVTCGAGRRDRSRSLAISNAPKDLSKLFDEQSLRVALDDLERQSKHIQIHHTQELAVAFGCGMFSLVTLFSLARGCSRSIRGPLLRPSEMDLGTA
jgi:hypothetical protein